MGKYMINPLNLLKDLNNFLIMDLDFMIVPENIGRILSPTIKIIVVLFLGALLKKALMKYRVKKSKIARMLMYSIAFYTIAPIFSAFDVLLNWQNLPAENTFMGMGFAFFFHAMGNLFYFLFLIEVYGKPLEIHKKNIILFNTIAILEVLSTLFAMIFKILQFKTAAQIFTAVHMINSLIIYYYNIYNSKKLRDYSDEEYYMRFTYMIRSGFSMISLVVLFVIDSFYIEFTIWSYMGWIILIYSTYTLYKAYLEI